MKLSIKKRDDAKELLEEHQKVTDALTQVDKASWFSMMSLANDKDSDSVEVRFNHVLARKALEQQKEWTERELAKLGIEIE